MDRQWASRMHIALSAISAALLLGATACSRQTADETDATDTRPEPGVVDVITGKAAVDAGQRAKDVIRESSEKRNRQLDESLEW